MTGLRLAVAVFLGAFGALGIPSAGAGPITGEWDPIEVGRPGTQRAVWGIDPDGLLLQTIRSGERGEADRYRSLYLTDAPEYDVYTLRTVFHREKRYGLLGITRVQHGIVFGFQNEQDYYAVSFSGKEQLLLQHITGIDITDLCATIDYPKLGEDHVVDLLVQPPLLQVSLDGQPILDTTDPAFQNGRIGFYADAPAPLRITECEIYPYGPPRLDIPLHATIRPYVLWAIGPEARLLWETNLPAPASVTLVSKDNSDRREQAIPKNGRLGNAAFKNLQPATEYHYQVKTGDIMLGEGRFQTDPGPAGSFRVGIIGDTKKFPDRFKTLCTLMEKRQPHFVVNLGDIVHTGPEIDQWAEYYFEPAASLLANAPCYVAIGNHDSRPRRYWFNHYLPYPGIGLERIKSGASNYFAFTYGSAAFLIFDCYFPLSPGSPQHRWMEKTLASEPFQKAVWRIVAGHEPPWSVGRGTWEPGNAEVRDSILPLCRQYGVQLLFSGHSHTYKRGYFDGVIAIVSGGGGCGYGDYQYHGVSQFVAQLLGYAILQYGMLDIKGNRLEWRCYSIRDELLDSMILENGGTSPINARTPLISAAQN